MATPVSALNTTVAPISPPLPQNAVVPVSHPAHPSHTSWLEILLTCLRAASTIGPAVVTLVDPKDAALAQGLGGIANAGLGSIPNSTN